MKKAKWFVLLVMPLLLIVLCIGFLWDKSIVTGLCLRSQNGSCLLIKGESPIYLSNQTHLEDPFEGLQTGDKILVVHDFVNDTYPGQTGAYLCLKIGTGNPSDIPQSVIDDLTALGWLEDNDTHVQPEMPGDSSHIIYDYEKPKTIVYSYNDAHMELEIPREWTHEFYKDENGQAYGIRFWPGNESTGKLALYYQPSFGVCGTGLKSEEFILPSGPKGHMGTYDNHAVFDFIAFREEEQCYVVMNEGADAWWNDYKEDAMRIITSIKLGK